MDTKEQVAHSSNFYFTKSPIAVSSVGTTIVIQGVLIWRIGEIARVDCLGTRFKGIFPPNRSSEA